jgi:hypothetical protein
MTTPPERLLPRSVKQALIAVMVMMILVLVLALESSPSTAFMYIGF